MNHLLRSLAPITDSGWELLDDEAAAASRLPSRRASSSTSQGPHGWAHSATNLGRTTGSPRGPVEGVTGAAAAGCCRWSSCGPTSRSRSRSSAITTAARPTSTSPTSTRPPTRSPWPRTSPSSTAGAKPDRGHRRGLAASRPALGQSTDAYPARGRSAVELLLHRDRRSLRRWRSDETSTRTWSRPPSTAAIRCSITCARSSTARSSGRPV